MSYLLSGGLFLCVIGIVWLGFMIEARRSMVGPLVLQLSSWVGLMFFWKMSGEPDIILAVSILPLTLCAVSWWMGDQMEALQKQLHMLELQMSSDAQESDQLKLRLREAELRNVHSFRTTLTPEYRRSKAG